MALSHCRESRRLGGEWWSSSLWPTVHQSQNQNPNHWFSLEMLIFLFASSLCVGKLDLSQVSP